MEEYTKHLFEVSMKDYEADLKDPDVKAGFDAYIKSIQNGGKKGADPGSSGDKSGNDADGNPEDGMGDASGEQSGQTGQQGSGGQSSGGGKSDIEGQQGAGTPGSGQDSGDPDMGTVMPSDMAGPSELGDIPGTPGGFFDKNVGDKIAEAEGYDKEGGSASNIEKSWKDRARDTAQKAKGKGAGWDIFVNKINNLNRGGSKNWKDLLRKVTGRCINPLDKRRAPVNKKFLVTQNITTFTDKDKLDAANCIMCWVDTSGSMSEEFLNACITETYQVALQKKPMSLVIVQFDTRVTDVQIFNNLGQLKKNLGQFKIKGGGGTDVKCCFDLFKTDKRFKNTHPELVMIFTDGYLDQYKRPAKHIGHLCWVICGNTNWELKYKDASTFRVYLDNKDFSG